MNLLIKKEGDFLKLFLHTFHKQKKFLMQKIKKSQLNAIVQIV